MNRRRYIYWATPLFVLLGCGAVLTAQLGSTAALVIGSIVAVVAWGVVWLRLYSMKRLRPEFAVLSVLPYVIYYVNPPLSGDVSMWQNLYALSWIASAAVLIASVRPTPEDTQGSVPRLTQDPLFLLMTPLICLHSAGSFFRYYTSLFTI